MYEYLTANTELDRGVLDELISHCCVIIDDVEEIMKPAALILRNRVLLDIIIRRPFNLSEIFMDALVKAEDNYADVLPKLEESKILSPVYICNQPDPMVAGEWNLNFINFFFILDISKTIKAINIPLPINLFSVK